MKACAILHGSVFDCTFNSVGEKGFPLSHIIQWSTSVTRPDQGNDLDADVLETAKFLELLLELDPRKRISARAALASDFLAEEPEYADSEADEMDVL